MRVYFNIAADGVVEDVGTLVNKVENLTFQLSLNQIDIKTNKSKVKSLTDTNAGLRYSYYGDLLIEFIIILF